MSNAGKPDFIPGLRGLRGFACMMVVLSHAAQTDGVHLVPHFPVRHWLGSLGVMIFFCLSGFLMSCLHDDNRGLKDWLRFCCKRIVRVYGLFVAALFVYGLTIYLLPASPLAFLTPSYLFSIATFERSWWLFWTVPVELFCYVLFIGLTICLSHLIRRPAWKVAAFSLLLLAAAFLLLPPDAGRMFMPWNYSAYFIGGMAGGLSYRYFSASLGEKQQLWPMLATLLLAMLAAIVFLPVFDWLNIDNPWPFSWFFSFFFSLMTLCIACLRGGCIFRFFNHRLLNALGTISFSLYFMHGLVLRLYSAAIGAQSGMWPLHLPVALFLSIMAAVMLYYVAERPLLRLLRRIGRALT